jgi:signal peptidase I
MTTPAKKGQDGGFNLLSRDNIEALTMAIIMAVMLKYFIVEAYKIPTGSMQPTLLGNDTTGTYDRIIVDKLSYHFRDPERFEVVVFKYPLNRATNFIKRICGMPGENFQVRDGDLWTRPDDTSEWKIIRRPRPVQLEVWKRIDPADPRYTSWRPDDKTHTWNVHGRDRIEARGDGSVRLPSDGGPVRDMYGDGYPDGMGAMLTRGAQTSGQNAVGDLRVTGSVEALAGCKRVVVELREADRRYDFELPGPAAPADAHPRIVANLGGTQTNLPTQALGKDAWKLRAGKSVSFAAQNMDDMLQLEIDGDIVATLEVPRSANQIANYTLREEGEGANFEDLEVYRDIYYTLGSTSTFKIPPGNYVMLGDNTQDSSDGREWRLAVYHTGEGHTGEGHTDEGRADDGFVRGNDFKGNPEIRAGGPEGNHVFFRDEFGDLHDFIERPGDRGPDIAAPFVPRNLITGRAIIVFWPMTWLYPPNWSDKNVPLLTRLKWIH